MCNWLKSLTNASDAKNIYCSWNKSVYGSSTHINTENRLSSLYLCYCKKMVQVHRNCETISFYSINSFIFNFDIFVCNSPNSVISCFVHCLHEVGTQLSYCSSRWISCTYNMHVQWHYASYKLTSNTWCIKKHTTQHECDSRYEFTMRCECAKKMDFDVRKKSMAISHHSLLNQNG